MTLASRGQHAGRRNDAAVYPTLCLSAAEIHVRGDVLHGQIVPYESEEAFEALKGREDTFAYRRRGEGGSSQVLLIALARESMGDTTPLPIREHVAPLARLIERQLVVALPKLSLRATRHGLERIRRKDDLVDTAFGLLRFRRPAALEGFHKFHRTVLRVRHEFLPTRGKTLMLTVEFRRHSEVHATVAELGRRGHDLRGLDVMGDQDGARRWLGTITASNGSEYVIRTDAGEVVVDGTAHHLEPSSRTFRTVFERTLGEERYEELRRAEWSHLSAEVCGQGYVERLQSVIEYLGRAGTLEIARGVAIKFGEMLALQSDRSGKDSFDLPAVQYCFSPDRSAIDALPARGLDRYGPMDGSSFDTKEPRVLIVCPDECQEEAEIFVRQLSNGTGDQAKGVFRRGFTGIYRLNRLHTRFAPVSLRGVRHSVGTEYVKTLRTELGGRKEPDIVIVVIRDEDAFTEHDNPYLAAKAFLLRQGIPSQEIRVSKMNSSPRDLPYILRDIAVATYAKLGGCPWTVTPTLPLAKEVVIGMAHAEFGSRRSARTRYMGITTVFNGDGTYLLAAGTPRCLYDDYPRELARSVRTTLARLAKDYGWAPGDMVRLVFHATKPLTGREINMVADEAQNALGSDIQVQTAFLTIEENHPYKVLAPGEPGQRRFIELLRGGHGQALVGTCAPPRGTMIDLGRSKRLLCVNGPMLMKREGESLPHPLQIELHPRSTYRDMSALVRQVFHFTGLSWRGMLPVAEPVTIYYPHLIARLLGRLSSLPDWSDDLLDTRLLRSRWFL